MVSSDLLQEGSGREGGEGAMDWRQVTLKRKSKRSSAGSVAKKVVERSGTRRAVGVVTRAATRVQSGHCSDDESSSGSSGSVSPNEDVAPRRIEKVCPVAKVKLVLQSSQDNQDFSVEEHVPDMQSFVNTGDVLVENPEKSGLSPEEISRLECILHKARADIVKNTE